MGTLHAIRRRPWALVLILLLAGFPLAAQDGDEGFLVRTLQGLLSDAGREVRIQGFEGALSSRASLREMTIADADGVWLILRDVALDWRRAALLERRIEVNELSAREIHLLRLPGGDDSALPSAAARPDFSLPELPVAINIGELRADRVVLEQPVTGQRTEMWLNGQMALEGGEGRATFRSERSDGQMGRFVFDGSFDNTTRFLAIDLDVAEGAGGIAASALNIAGRPPLGLVIRGAGPLDAFRADIRMESDGEDRISGEVLVGPGEDGLDVALDLSGDLRPLMASEMHAFFGAQTRMRAVAAMGEDGSLRLNALSFVSAAMQMVGRVYLNPQMQPQVVELLANLVRSDRQPVPLPGTGGAVTIASAQLAIEYDLEVSPDWQISGALSALDLPQASVEWMELDARGQLIPPNGAQGAADPFQGIIDFSAGGITSTDPALAQALGSTVSGFASLSWPAPGAPLDIEGIVLEGETLGLSARGQMEGARFTGFIEAEAYDLERFSQVAGRDLGGHLLLTSDGSINLFTSALDVKLSLTGEDLTLDQREADLFLRGPARAGFDLLRDTEGTYLRGLRLRAGALAVDAEGRYLPGALHVVAEARVPDLSPLGEGFGGQAQLALQLDSTGGVDILSVDGRVLDVQPGDLPGAAVVRALMQGESALQLRATRADGMIALERLSFEGPRLAVSAVGALPETGTQGTDLALELTRLDAAGFAAEARGILQGSATLQAEGETGRRLRLNLDATQGLRFGSRMLDGLLGGQLQVNADVLDGGAGVLDIARAELTTGAVQLSASGQQGRNGAGAFALRARLDSLARIMPGMSGALALDARASRAAGDGPYAVRVDLEGPSSLSARAEGTASTDLQLALALQASVEAGIVNPVLDPMSVQGQVRFQGRLDGRPVLDGLTGTLSVSDMRFVSPWAELAIEGINAQGNIQGERLQLEATGRGQMGGTARLSGTIGLLGGHPTDLEVSVAALRIASAPILEVAVTGAARLTGSIANGPLLRGTVGVDQAEIRIPNSVLGRYGHIPAGLRHIGEGAASARTRARAGILTGERGSSGQAPIFLDLTVNAPGRVFIRGRGLDAETGGTLRLSGSTRQVIPSGSFTLIRGRLDLLGNRFVLTDGSASLVGSFVPYISLIATTESAGALTSVILEGEATSPQIRFESVPELPEDEVLARLVFRRSLTTLSPFQAAQLGLSVATLTGRAEDSIFSRARSGLGLDDLDFTTNEQGVTALRAGRYVTERVYTDLRLDSAGRSEVSINLDLSPSVTLRGRAASDGRSAVGIFFERDY
jgi:translocation and assembly module TamB